MSRTYTFGEIGSSLGQFFSEHLKHIALNDKPQPFRYACSRVTRSKSTSADSLRLCWWPPWQ